MHPRQFDPVFYREIIPELKEQTDEELLDHFLTRGRHDGLPGTRRAMREHLHELLEDARDALEIGPNIFPMIKGPVVKYFDVLSTEQLRAQWASRRPDLDAPRIDFVSPTGDLSIVTGSYQAVLSSHCIEHQPDLVQHLKDVERLLGPQGRYVLFAPDKRYCYDYPLPESSLADVLQAHVERRKVHTLGNIVASRALATHNDRFRHWAGDHMEADYTSGVAARAQDAVREFVEAQGAYIDVHAWRFTPDSFEFIIDRLAEMGLSPLRIGEVHDTVRNRFEFSAVLVRA